MAVKGADRKGTLSSLLPEGSLAKRAVDFIRKPDEDIEKLLKDYKTNLSYDTSIWNRQNYNNLNSLRDVPSMVNDPIIGSALAVLMEAAFQSNEDQRTYWINSPYPKIVEELDKFHERISMDATVLTLAYNLLLWGNFAFKHKFNSKMELEMVVPVPNFTTLTPIILSNKNMGFMVQNEYKYPHEYTFAQLMYFRDYGGMLQNSFYTVGSQSKEQDQLNNEFIYSPSYLSTASKAWKNINIIEDALILNRMDQSNYYRVISVDVGDKVYSKNAIKVLNYYRNIFKKVRRVSYDSNGMSSKGTGHEFEVIIPKSSKQDVKFDSVGGNVEIRALKDLDVQYQKLFSSLRIQPSMIGFSEDIPSSLGDSPAILWDKRFARTVKMVLYSTFRAIKEIDYVYLRSRGYDVKRSDWNYRTVAISTLEDKERKDLLSQAVKNLKEVSGQFQAMELDYNKEYLTRSLLGPALSAASVDIEQLLDTNKEKKKVVSASNLMLKDREIFMKDLVTVGILSEKELPKFKKDKITSSKGDEAPFQVSQGKVSIEYIKNSIGVYPSDASVDISSTVKLIEKRGKPTKVVSEMETIPIKTPVSFVADKPADFNITVGELESGEIASVRNLAILSDGQYVFSNKVDLVNYIYMQMSGYKNVVVQSVYQEDK